MNPCLSIDTQEACFQVACGVPSLSPKGPRDEAPPPSMGRGGLVPESLTPRESLSADLMTSRVMDTRPS